MYEKIEQLMIARGVTAYRVSKETGITQQSISDWKHGKSKPSAETLFILAKYFGVRMEYFMEGAKK